MSKMTIQQAAKALGSRFKPTPGTKLVGSKWTTLYTLDGKVVTAAEVIAAVNKGKKLSMASRAQRYRAKLSLASPEANSGLQVVSKQLFSAMVDLNKVKGLTPEQNTKVDKIEGLIKQAGTAISALQKEKDGEGLSLSQGQDESKKLIQAAMQANVKAMNAVIKWGGADIDDLFKKSFAQLKEALRTVTAVSDDD